MSNHLAIATVTATLQRMLQTAIQISLEGARATTVRPNEVGSATPQTGVNIFLYQVVNNHTLAQNAEMRNRSSRMGETKRWVSALDLHYMISFYGNEIELEPQRLMGSVIRALTDQRVLTKELIDDTVADSNFTFLADSDLMEQVEEINIIPLDLSLEDLSKVWSVFFQTPYNLSVAYRATVVMIPGETPSEKALPVRSRQFGGIVPFFNQPKIDRVISLAGQFEAILSDSTLLIEGKHLKSNITEVWIGEMQLTPTEISDTKIKLPLTSLPAESLRAGMQTLQVLHRNLRLIPTSANNGAGTNPTSSSANQMLPLNKQSTLSSAVQSNVVSFLIRPRVTKVSVSKWQGAIDEPRVAEVRVRTDVTIGRKQRVILVMNELSTENPAAYLFEAAPRRTDSVWITIPIKEVKSGRYLVRLQVDGAESQLTVDTNRNSPTFNQFIGPKIVIKEPI
ncbi:MAG TPA: DUF4255 domain-containing protein [Cyanobacteria bacterium UBA11162]|nr:DUF4255 domain-containing protein [Cyanobacteria bacterium UBA11162]